MTSKSNTVAMSSMAASDHAVQHDFGGEQLLSTTVISAVADATGAQPLDLPPLYEAINPDTLDSLFRPTDEGGGVPDQITFTYSGYAVTVHGDGTVIVDEASQ
jgi:hypothetical protein